MNTLQKKTNAINIGATNIEKIKWNDLPKEIANPVFSLIENEWSEPFETSLGWHIVKVTNINKETTKSFEEVRYEIETSIQEEKAADIVFDLANKLEDELAAESNLETAANNIGLNVNIIIDIDKNGLNKDNKATNFPYLNNILPIIFSSKIKKISGPLDTEEGGLLFFRLDSIADPKAKPLDEVRNIVEKDLKKEKRSKMLAIVGKNLIKEIKNGESIEKIAAKFNTTTKTANSFTRTDGSAENPILSNKIVNQLFNSNIGEVVSALLPNGDFSIAILTNIEKSTSNDTDIEYTRLKDSLNNSFHNDIKQQYKNALAKKYNVKIFQENINSLDISQALNAR